MKTSLIRNTLVEPRCPDYGGSTVIISKYPQFRELNTQIVEQSTLSYMNKEHFIMHFRLILWYHNQTNVKNYTDKDANQLS